MVIIDAHRDRFGVEPICAVLAGHGVTIASSGYYAAKTTRPPSRRALSDAALAETIEATFWDPGEGPRRLRGPLATAPRTNTAHLALERPDPALALPGLHIAEVVAAAASRAGHRKVGLLGTHYTMDGHVYPTALGRRGIESEAPNTRRP